MRPDILFPLFADVGCLKGIGPAVKPKLAKMGIETVKDMLFHLPSGLVDRSFRPALDDAPSQRVITVLVTIDEHRAAKRGSRQPYQVACHNETGTLLLTFFRPYLPYIQSNLPVGEQRLVSGRVERYHGVLQMAHPDYILPPEKAADLYKPEPIYPLTAGISNKQMRGWVEQALKKLPDLPEWGDVAYLSQQHWASFAEVLRAAHYVMPTGGEQRQETEPQADKNRLAYDEVLANQLAMAVMRQHQQRKGGVRLALGGALETALRQCLPFALTGGQEQMLGEIASDVNSGQRMLRLLQGDVGSGKTVVALIAMLAAVEAGKQAALMAPTEIVARQHVAWISAQCEALGIKVALLTGSVKGAQRRQVQEGMESGAISLVVGTHALFQESVSFHDLALVVIDEQHRFGVNQRLRLSEKGHMPPHVLLMTATPIPRSLTMAMFGDMDVSRLSEKPPGRKPVDTRVIPLSRYDEVVARLEKVIESGARAYWICPLVEESDKGMALAAAEQRAVEFRERFGAETVGLVHGRISGTEREETLGKFQRGEHRILIATTVVEVGVNVPEATIMVIEHAERFGLAQLHQLRGRVGRGEAASHCLLLYSESVGQSGIERLKTMRQSEDGFFIAEEDLRIRGGGELLGTRQSGLPVFRFADLAEHKDIIQAARDDARLIVQRDPILESERGKALRILLYLFEYDRMVKYLRSG